MSYEPTINNGGPPVRVWREPVEKPEIHRGAIAFKLEAPPVFHSDRIATIITRQPGFLVTYHRIFVQDHDGDAAITLVPLSTVVTWERVPLQ